MPARCKRVTFDTLQPSPLDQRQAHIPCEPPCLQRRQSLCDAHVKQRNKLVLVQPQQQVAHGNSLFARLQRRHESTGNRTRMQRL